MWKSTAKFENSVPKWRPPTMSQTVPKKHEKIHTPRSTNIVFAYESILVLLLFIVFRGSSTVCMFLGILRPNASKSMPKTSLKSQTIDSGTSPRNGMETTTTKYGYGHVFLYYRYLIAIYCHICPYYGHIWP